MANATGATLGGSVASAATGVGISVYGSLAVSGGSGADVETSQLRRAQQMHVETSTALLEERTAQIDYTSSRMRLLLDNSIVGRTHSIFL